MTNFPPSLSQALDATAMKMKRKRLSDKILQAIDLRTRKLHFFHRHRRTFMTPMLHALMAASVSTGYFHNPMLSFCFEGCHSGGPASVLFLSRCDAILCATILALISRPLSQLHDICFEGCHSGGPASILILSTMLYDFYVQ